MIVFAPDSISIQRRLDEKGGDSRVGRESTITRVSCEPPHHNLELIEHLTIAAPPGDDGD